jgi:two-component system sensor kinase FixL
MRLTEAPLTNLVSSGACDTAESRLRLTAMTTMASTLTHELLQPLAAASNFIEACARQLRARGEGYEELLAMIGHARSQTTRAADMVKRARTFVVSGAVTGQSESVATLVERALAATVTDEHGIDVVTTIQPSAALVVVDRIQIEQVLTNLLANSVEALDDSTLRRIEIGARRQVDDVVICVRDYGPGLTDETMRRWFEPMYTTKAGGTGLGLPICKSIVEAHGGRMWPERPAGGGAAFCFSLPAGAGQEAGA